MASLYKLYGSLASPYSMKMRAVLRYRRIAHMWVSDAARIGEALKHVKVPVIPVIEYPDGQFANDTTPLIFDLERRFKQRRILPKSPALAFIACLIEDMADEWCTKIMFEYRWRRPRDQDVLATQLALDMVPFPTQDDVSARAEAFKTRQVDRMDLVGATAQNQPIIEESFLRLIHILDDLFTAQPFLFGTAPSLADFALYGQLSQLAHDPTPAEILQQRSPRLARWIARLDDASGVEGEWPTNDQKTMERLEPLLRYVADIYLPFLDANAKAVATEAETMHVRILGQPFEQAPFRYQSRCFIALRERYAELKADQKALIDPMLKKIGALQFITQGGRS